MIWTCPCVGEVAFRSKERVTVPKVRMGEMDV
jgi:hypothetical protein